MPAQNEIKSVLAYVGWIGAPVLRWRGRVIDGRERMAAARELGLSNYPIVTARTAQEAARKLVAVGHSDRAIELGLFPAGLTEREDQAAWCNVPPEMFIVAKRKSRTHLPRRRAKTIESIVALLRTARARGDQTIQTADLMKVIERYMYDKKA